MSATTMCEIACQDTFTKCSCCKRVKLILHEYNKIISNKKETTENQLQNETFKLINNFSSEKQYSNVDLLNDFYHVKYNHNTNDNPNQFNLFYNYIFDNDDVLVCDIEYCPSAKRYYNQNRRSYNSAVNSYNDTYGLNLLSRIHTYFIHSYDSSQLTPDEIQFIENKLNEYKEEDEDILNDKKLELLSTIINNKKRNTLARSLRLNYTKFMTTETDQSINCKELSAVLANHDIIIDEVNLKNIFDEYNYDKPQLINDLCDILINEKLNDILLPQILKNELRYDDQNHQQMIYPWSLKTCGGGGG
eukprot:170474_1